MGITASTLCCLGAPSATAQAPVGDDLAITGPVDSASVEAAAVLAEGARPVSAPDIAAALQAAGATNVQVEPWRRELELMRLPTNLFSVSSAWASWIEDNRKHIAFYGRWNYRYDVVGSGAPDDVAAAALSGFDAACWRNVSTGLTTQSSDGTHTNLSYLQTGQHQRSIWGIRDRTSGFRLQSDMGFAWIDMQRVRTGCRGTKQGTFFHEHNQSGSGGWSASVGVGALNVSYSGSGGDTLQRGTPVNYFSD